LKIQLFYDLIGALWTVVEAIMAEAPSQAPIIMARHGQTEFILLGVAHILHQR
jgi:hypothetical protein